MKKVVAVLVLMAGFLPLLHGQKTRYSQDPPTRKPAKSANKLDYPIKVHISGVHLRPYPNEPSVFYVDATLDGKKVDLMGDAVPIVPGDYVARFRKKSHSTNLQQLGQKFEILFPDNTYWPCSVEGFSE
jgi:hypothetical protein